jgi:hypothetical protein
MNKNEKENQVNRIYPHHLKLFCSMRSFYEDYCDEFSKKVDVDYYGNTLEEIIDEIALDWHALTNISLNSQAESDFIETKIRMSFVLHEIEGIGYNLGERPFSDVFSDCYDEDEINKNYYFFYKINNLINSSLSEIKSSVYN